MRNTRVFCLSLLTTLLAACGGEDPVRTVSAGPALGKRVVFSGVLLGEREHAYLVDTGAPGSWLQLSGGLVGAGGVGAVYGSGHPRFVTFVEHRPSDSVYQVVDLEAVGRSLGRTELASARPRVSPDGAALAAVLSDTGIPTVGLRLLPDPNGVFQINHPTPPAPTQVARLRIAPDSARVVWSDAGRLWQRTFSAGSVEAAAQVLETTTGLVQHLYFTPDSSAVLWLEEAGDRIRQRRFADPTATTLTPTLATGETIRDFRLSADGSRLVYRATDAAGRGRLFAVELASPGTATELTPAWADVFGPNLTDGAQFEATTTDTGWQLRPDGDQVAFRSGGGTSGQTRGLYTVEVATPGAATLRSVATGSHVGHLGYADAGASLVWTATPNGTHVDSRLWRGPSQGAAAPDALFGPLTSGADDAIYDLEICGDDTAVVRWVDWVAGAVSTGGTAPRNSADLYMVRTDGSSSTALLTPANTVVEEYACVE